MWSYEQGCTNEIDIFKDGVKVASIISDDENNSPEDFEIAKFIVESCNKNS